MSSEVAATGTSDGHGDSAAYGPVRDWATDFDHIDPDYNANSPDIWADLRQRCPIAHSNRYGSGVWMPVTHEAVTRIAYDTETFSSSGIFVADAVPDPGPEARAIMPISADPPYHTEARQPLLPYFAPKRVNQMADEIRTICKQLLDDIGDAEYVDGAEHYAQHVPTMVTCRMLGFPLEDAEQIRTWVRRGFESVQMPAAERIALTIEIQKYIGRMIKEHRAEPRDDLTTSLINATYRGEPFSNDRVRMNVYLLLVAGVDTTWSSIGSSLWHLGQHPSDVARLVREPELWPTAVEELLRVFAPVTMGRKVTRDVDFNGCPMKEGDLILLPFPAANVDPTVWDRADEVVIDRAENRHYAFGIGIHRCLGSNLGRLEMRIALEEFVRRFPRFELVASEDVGWSVGQVKGPRKVPLRILERMTALPLPDPV